MLTVQIKKQLAHFTMDLHFTTEAEILVLAGPSGSGKTTILNSIAGLIQPDDGCIAMDQTVYFQPKRRPMPARDRNVGYLFQDYALFPHMTVRKNIYYGLKKEDIPRMSRVIDQLLEVLGIGHLLDEYPYQISGGEQQRVGLARALATEPSVLLLDEPLSALDSKTRSDCQNELLRLHQLWNIPFIIVTHDLEEAKKLGDRIIYLNEGQIEREEAVHRNFVQ